MAPLEDTGIHVRWLATDGRQIDAGGDDARPVQVERMSVDLVPRTFVAMSSGDWVVRPTGLHWVARTHGGLDGMLAGLAAKPRRLARQGLARLAELERRVSHPSDAGQFDAWAELYTQQIGRLVHGRNYVSRYRREIVAEGSPFELITWSEGAEVVAGMVFRIDRGRNALVARFVAVRESWRRSEIPRAMYLTLGQLAHERGLLWLSLGNDANFYGTATSPGLAAFKLRLGFVPVPSTVMGNTGCSTVADRVLNFSGITPPVLRFAYRHVPMDLHALEPFVEGTDRLELVSAIPGGFTDSVLDSLPAHRVIQV